MTNVTFFLLEQTDDEHPAAWLTACQLATSCYRKKQRASVLCDDKQTAEAFDELLWQRPTDAFVPHNLVGEGPNGGAPIEIDWPQSSSKRRGFLINLSQDLPTDPQHYRQIYDFVPVEESAKQQARDRYKHYRAAGFTMHTLPASSINENTDG